MEESESTILVNSQQSLSQRLASHSEEQPNSTIYRVHKALRSVNDKAYDPEVIAIGPYHHGSQNLEMLEEHKIRYLHLLLKNNNQNLEMYVSAIKPLEQEARECYAEAISLPSAKFIEMLVLDGCFIIQLVRKHEWRNLRENNDPIFQMDWIRNSLMRDMILFENQIPFFILLKLLDLIVFPNQHTMFISLLLIHYSNLYPGKGYSNNSCRRPDEIKHILDLVHGDWLPTSSLISITGGVRFESGQVIDNATKLVEANVGFKKVDRNSLFDVGFQNGKISLAPLIIGDGTETLFRNLIAFEQYFPNLQTTYVTSYALFMDCLIDTSKDVETLSKYKIIDNWLGSDEEVAVMFNKLTYNLCLRSENIHAQIFDDVNRHCSQPINKNLASLRHKYLNSPWAIISVIVGTILLILTITQTVFSILQVASRR